MQQDRRAVPADPAATAGTGPASSPAGGPATSSGADPAHAAALALGRDALLRIDGRECIEWIDARFTALTGFGHEAAVGRPWRELLQWRDLAHGEAELHRADGGTVVVRLHETAADADGRRHAALEDRREIAALRARAERDALLLDMARSFGRLGLWEREIPGGRGTWDDHMFRIFGLDPAGGAPPYDRAHTLVHPDDRTNLMYPQSTRRAGRYERRYRVLRPDGSVRHVHSMWEVCNGPSGEPARTLGVMMDDTEMAELARSFDETRATLDLAVELGNIAIWRHDLRSDRLYYNDRGFAVLQMAPRPDGLALDEVRALIHPDDIPAVVESARRALAGDGPTDMQARYRRADGQWRHILTRRVVQRDAQGTPVAFVGVALDVTDQVHRTQHALELARRLELIATAGRIGLWSLDLQTGRPEWSGHMHAMHGLAPGTPAPDYRQWVESFVHPDDRERMRQRGRVWLQPGATDFEDEFRVVRTDGSVRRVVSRTRAEKHDGHTMLFGLLLDITEQRETEAALRLAHERVALAARGAGIGTWELDVASERAVWDEQMFRLRGLEPRDEAPDEAERRGQVHPDDRGLVRTMQRHALARREACSYEFRVRWPDGRERWIASRAAPVIGHDGHVARLLGVNWDVTDARATRQALQDKEVAERESRAKSQFLARMSHELRTPLNAVLGFTQLLAADLRHVPSQHAQLEHIRTAGEHLLALIDQVLDLSRMESDQLPLALEPVSLPALLGEVLPMVEPLAREHGVAIVRDEVDGVALADRTRLRQVLINLLTNAVKYNRRGGTVRLDAQHDGTRVHVAVADTGRGFTAAQLAHVFEPFNRLGAERSGVEGTGIGLAIAKGLVERMGGRIGVSSEPGVGSVFALELPAAAHDAVAAPAPPQRAFELTGTTSSSGAHGRVLYIEDNPVNVLVVQEIVHQRTELRLDTAADGESGVARAIAAPPALVLIDMQLPDIDGFEVLRRLRAHPATATVPCVALSANALPEDVQRARAAGFDDYWTKPIDLRAFVRGLQRLLGEA